MPRFRRFRTLLAVGVVCALVLAACGSDDDSGDGGGDSSAAAPECLTFADLYALVGPESEGFSNWTDAQELATELGSSTEFPDADLVITAPGEESGTYGSFVEIALGDISEERAAEGAITEEQVETTRKDYESSANDNVIIEGVGGNDGSLGWVGFAFAEQNADTIREIEIDGGSGCIAPTAETIADSSYPLSRGLYIYVNTDKAKDNAALAGYIYDYLSDEGREGVEAAGYIPLPDEQWEETRTAWDGAGVPEPTGELSGSVTVSGSSTVEPISALIAENFVADNSGVAIDVQGPGTSDGFEQFCNGETDVSDASRPIDEEEVALCQQNGVNFVELLIGYDGITVITRG